MGYHLTNDAWMDVEIGSGSAELNTSGYIVYTPKHGNYTRDDSVTGNETATLANDVSDIGDIVRTIFEVIFMLTVMVSAVVGNTLVIMSVYKFSKLQITANSFIVSLAFADLLVAVLVMPFNASQIITGVYESLKKRYYGII